MKNSATFLLLLSALASHSAFAQTATGSSSVVGSTLTGTAAYDAQSTFLSMLLHRLNSVGIDAVIGNMQKNGQNERHIRYAISADGALLHADDLGDEASNAYYNRTGERSGFEGIAFNVKLYPNGSNYISVTAASLRNLVESDSTILSEKRAGVLAIVDNIDFATIRFDRNSTLNNENAFTIEALNVGVRANLNKTTGHALSIVAGGSIGGTMSTITLPSGQQIFLGGANTYSGGPNNLALQVGGRVGLEYQTFSRSRPFKAGVSAAYEHTRGTMFDQRNIKTVTTTNMNGCGNSSGGNSSGGNSSGGDSSGGNSSGGDSSGDSSGGDSSGGSSGGDSSGGSSGGSNGGCGTTHTTTTMSNGHFDRDQLYVHAFVQQNFNLVRQGKGSAPVARPVNLFIRAGVNLGIHDVLKGGASDVNFKDNSRQKGQLTFGLNF